MVQLIKKGGLRERANRSRAYQGSENTATTLQPNRYSKNPTNNDLGVITPTNEPVLEQQNSIDTEPNSKN
jgi:hypothetical protein